ncbi:MAG: hypothetical protein GX456_03795 [Verrucomicrobia bacterium]|nr:hypothetical protein [Verrucomicrobiota bacterium]
MALTKHGRTACATRRVGGDQNASLARSACRLTSSSAVTSGAMLTASQYAMKARGDSTPAIIPPIAAAMPNPPVTSMTGASARR